MTDETRLYGRVAYTLGTLTGALVLTLWGPWGFFIGVALCVSLVAHGYRKAISRP